MKLLLKKLAALGLTVLMLLTLTALPAYALATELTGDKTATVVGDDYYTALESAAGTKLTGDPRLTMFKHVQDGNRAPISGVEFKYAKVGNLYQIKDGATTVMAYGVSNDFATAVGLTDEEADYEDSDNLYFKDFNEIQTATREASKDTAPFKTYVDDLPSSVTTNAEGKTTEMASGYGLYLVVEYDVSNAKVDGQKIAITESQSPFLVALPTFGTDNYWDEKIEASVKNSTGTANVQKKIVTGGTDGESTTDGNEDVADTDTTSIGDIVHYRHKATLPEIPANSPEEITKFVLTDNISKGLTVDTSSFTVITYDGTDRTELTATTDYTVTTPSAYTGSDTNYTGGNTFTVTFTPDDGLADLTTLAKSDTATAKEVYVYYSATVNENAVIGPNAANTTANSGNPNEVMLAYKVGNGAEIGTAFDKVTHFTFGIDVTKNFEGDPVNDVNAVTFKLYSEKTDGTKTYYNFGGSAGSYHTPVAATNEATATELKLDSNKKISLKGLEEGTYYLVETATVGGYNLLKEPVEITIDAVDNGTNGYVQDTENTGGADHIGTLTAASNTDGKISLTVVNTKGFELPSTGGAGIWMFVIGGVAVIAVGCAYFLLPRKKRQE